jgi:hypothetical protein
MPQIVYLHEDLMDYYEYVKRNIDALVDTYELITDKDKR